MPFETGICVTCHHQNEPSIIEKFAKLKIEMFDEEDLDRKKVSMSSLLEHSKQNKKIAKGQLISKELFDVIVSTKKKTKFFERFLP